MNRAQRKLVGAGAIVFALLGMAAAREFHKAGARCKQDIVSWIDSRGRFVQAKAPDCD